MSLDSVLYLASAPSPHEMEAALLRSGLFEPSEPYKTVRKVAAEAIVISLFTYAAPFNPYEEAGIAPQRAALFSCTDKSKSGLWTAMTVRGLMTLLAAFEGDALFLHAPDKPALMRKAGAVVLDPRCGLWGADIEPQVLPLIAVPYAFGIIPIT